MMKRDEEEDSFRLNFSCLPAQADFVKSTEPLVAFVGGLGSGKSRAACYKAIQLCLMNAPCPGIFIEPSYSLIRDVAFPTFREVLEELGLEYKVHISNFEIEIDGKAKILFRSGEEPERLVGINAAWAIIDEPGVQTELVAKNALARLRHPKAKQRQLCFTGTPEGLNWFYEWCQRKDVKVIKAKTTDNPFLPSTYVDDLKKNYTDEEVNAYINGEFVRFEGGWYKVKPRVIKPVEDINGFQIYRLPSQCSNQLVIGIDTGGGLLKDSSAVVIVDKRDKALVACWSSSAATIDEIADRVEYAFNRFQTSYHHKFEAFGGKKSNDVPFVVIETNGIGEATWQAINIKKRIPAVKQRTTEAVRYQGMLLTKRAIEAGIIEGPQELADETDKLIVDNGRFKGPKDISMAIGFCLREIERNPYKAPEQSRDSTFRMKI
jgi:PBSX family phage terminase large subunit